MRVPKWILIVASVSAGMFVLGFHGVVGNIPLNDLGAGTYQGYQGGLYPGGINVPPPGHVAAAMQMANQIVPRDSAGNPSVDGKIGLITIGMSNATQESAPFERQEDVNLNRNGRVVIINGAVSGQTASIIRDPSANYWTIVMSRVAAMSMTPAQVQVVWVKEANANPANNFPLHAQQFEADLRAVVQVLHDKFPNARLCYLSSRIYAGYATTTLNPEPQAYECGFATKWLIEDQINGAADLNYNPANGAVRAPLLLWGAYMWADGLNPRSDGLTWMQSEFEADGTHPSTSGEYHVANLLSSFFAADSTVQPFYSRLAGIGLYGLNANADTYVLSTSPNSNFGNVSTLNTQGGATISNVYLRFDTRNVPRPIAYAKLGLRVGGGSGDNMTVAVVNDSSWTENGITYANAPAIGSNFATIPVASKESSLTCDVTSALNADVDGVITFAIRAAGTGAGNYLSKEAGQPPRLTLTTLEPADVFPFDFSLFRGMVVSGGLPELRISDDLRLVLRPFIVLLNSEAPVQLIVSGHATYRPVGELRFRVEASVSVSNIGQRIALFNFVSQTYEDVDFRAATLSDSVAEVVVTSNASRFVDPSTGAVRARLSWKDTGPVVAYPWSVKVDQTVWHVTP